MVVAWGLHSLSKKNHSSAELPMLRSPALGIPWRVDESNTEMCCQFVGGLMVRILSRQFGPSESDGEIVLVDARTADVVGVHDLQRVGVGVVGGCPPCLPRGCAGLSRS